MLLVLFVLNNADLLDQVLDAWEETGVTGVTILHSTGLGRTRMGPGLRDDIPLLPSLKSLLQHEEYFSRTMISVVPDNEMADKVISATNRVVGDLDRPDTGLLVVIPLEKVYGLNKQVGSGDSP